MSPPTVGELFNLPATGEYEWEGKKYPVRQPRKDERHAFSQWLAGEASAFVERQTHLPESGREKHRRGLRTEAAGQQFHYFSPAAVLALGTPAGAAKLMSIMLQNDGFAECDPDVCERMLMARVERTAARMLREVAAADPKAVKAWETILSLFPDSTTSNGTTPTASSSPAAPTPTSAG